MIVFLIITMWSFFFWKEVFTSARGLVVEWDWLRRGSSCPRFISILKVIFAKASKIKHLFYSFLIPGPNDNPRHASGRKSLNLKLIQNRFSSRQIHVEGNQLSYLETIAAWTFGDEFDTKLALREDGSPDRLMRGPVGTPFSLWHLNFNFREMFLGNAIFSGKLKSRISLFAGWTYENRNFHFFDNFIGRIFSNNWKFALLLFHPTNRLAKLVAFNSINWPRKQFENTMRKPHQTAMYGVSGAWK